MTKRERTLVKMTEEIWQLGKENKISCAEWAAILLEIQINIMRPYLEQKFVMNYIPGTVDLQPNKPK